MMGALTVYKTGHSRASVLTYQNAPLQSKNLYTKGKLQKIFLGFAADSAGCGNARGRFSNSSH
jgi:hypothetical protein